MVHFAFAVAAAEMIEWAFDALGHHCFEFAQVRCGDIAWQALVCGANCCGHSDDFAEHAENAHYAGGGEGDVRHADMSAAEEEVIDIAGVEAAVWHRVWFGYSAMVGAGPEGLLEFFGIFGVGEMEVDIPGDAGDRKSVV